MGHYEKINWMRFLSFRLPNNNPSPYGNGKIRYPMILCLIQKKNILGKISIDKLRHK